MSDDPPELTQRPGCLIIIVALLGLYQIIFASRVLQQAHILTGHPIPIAIQVGLAVGWALAFFVAAVGLVRGKWLALRYSGWLMVAFFAYNLLRIALFAQADYDRSRLPFLIGLTLLILVVPMLVLLRRD